MVKNDKWIKDMARQEMIEPLNKSQAGEGEIGRAHV